MKKTVIQTNGNVDCNKEGHLSQKIGSSMFYYKLIVCDEHQKELPN